MKNLLLFILFLLISSIAIAQQIFTQITFGGPSSTASAIAVNSQDHVFIGTYYNEGVYISTNHGLNWMNVKPHANVREVNCIALTSGGKLIVGQNGTNNDGKGVFVSTNNGSTWTKMSNGLPAASVTWVAVGTNGYVYAATGKTVYCSTDTCNSWISKSSGLSTTYNVIQVVCAPNGNLYAYQYRSIYRSTNYGDTWTKIDNGWVSDDIWSIFISKKGYLYVATNLSYIYRSTNNGDSFSKVSSGLNVYNGKVFSLGEDINQNLYAGSMNPSTVSILFRSTDDGLNWTTLGTAICYNNLATLVFNSQGYLYASCGGALYKSQQPIVTRVEEDISSLRNDFTLEQNFPNPFNPTTTIGFGIPEKINVRLSIFNILGEEIKILLKEEKEAGYHSTDFNASDLSSGVYFYQLRAGSYVDTKKMILLR